MLNRSAFVNLRIMKIKILIISLLRSPDRREAIAARLDALGLAYNFVDAVDALGLANEQVQKIQSNQSAKRDYGRTIGSTEIACALSHLKAYESILTESLDGAIILEDDALVDERFAPFANWLSRQGSAPQGLWLLGGGEYLEKQVTKNYFDFAILATKPSVTDNSWGKLFQIKACYDKLARACGYFIDAQTAQSLLFSNNPPVALADDWPFFIDSGLIKSAYLCRPFLIQHPIEITGQSLLQAQRGGLQTNLDSRKKLSGRLKEQLGYYRALYRLKVWCHQFKHRLFP